MDVHRNMPKTPPPKMEQRMDLESRVAPARLEPDLIMTINAHGPYNHAVWQIAGSEVTNEEALTGRAQFLVRTISGWLEPYLASRRGIRTSVADIGCYDGWILNQLEAKELGELVGYEPRAKNLRKGEFMRRLSGFQTRARFVQAGLQDVNEPYDVVLCLGLLHHMESLAGAVKKLAEICREKLFIETICLDASHETDELEQELEPKDIVYRIAEKRVGLVGQKLESDYYDGSTQQTTIVSIPSVSALVLHLELAGFTNVRVLVPASEYRRQVWKDSRPMNAVCVVAEKAKENHDFQRRVSDFVRSHEIALATELLPAPYQRPLEEALGILQALDARTSNRESNAVVEYAARPTQENLERLQNLSLSNLTPTSAEVLWSLRFNTIDKVRLELAKSALSRGLVAEAEAFLLAIVTRLNADWRSCYRAFALLCLAHLIRRESTAAQRFRQLCEESNPGFPIEGVIEEARRTWRVLL